MFNSFNPGGNNPPAAPANKGDQERSATAAGRKELKSARLYAVLRGKKEKAAANVTPFT